MNDLDLPSTAPFYDDAKIQQLVKGKIEPEISFLFYEVRHEKGTAGVIHVEPSYKKPHIIIKDYGKLREGQIVIRKGSSTNGANFEDLLNMFYNYNNPYFMKSIQILNAQSNILNSIDKTMAQLKSDEDDIEAEARKLLGLQ